jgi:predicted double-glycine peptidase
MSRTDIDAASLAAYLRRMAGDGSMEWSYEPMQTSVLLDIADMLDENAKLRERIHELEMEGSDHFYRTAYAEDANRTLEDENAKLRELADAVREFVEDTHCEDCPHRRDCYDNNLIFCAKTFSHNAFAAMRKLGIEVER